ncbi:hypothetical protein HS088_TW04G01595 [Tripterygium wilfordii]|uniref:Uncharacterized protein n=1 Tax=Tripterygium wilfordii TaxID=458696 RepID=A0A7J7DTD5_TRIWF|nr:hypothetical protein HS088_TW04G01595 [Tripterygium wilfordii]
MKIYRKRGRDNFLRCTYVLHDGVNHTKGFIKDPEEAQRYPLTDGAPPLSAETEKDLDLTEKSSERQKTDLTNNQEFDLTNERFLVPEMIFQPADLGMNEAGLAECIVPAINSCHPFLHPVLYERERDLRPLVPDNYHVKITTQEDPILGVWRGGSLLASTPDFEGMCVTKSEYEEHGSARCPKRFFH